jgi:hypothetical protein
MPEPRRRPFTVADAMILVAATTPSLILLRIAVNLGLLRVGETHSPHFGFFGTIFLGVACLLAAPLLTLPILTLRYPRPDRKRAIRGPGFVACAVFMAGSVFPIVTFTEAMLIHHPFGENLDLYYAELIRNLTSSAGPMILGAWLALAVVGRWRPRPTCADRLGRVAGAGWVLLYLWQLLENDVVLPLIWWWEGLG